MINMARVGRSLGIHLMLATQSPGRSITDDIQNNTQLRISLRVLHPSESNSIIGTPDAAGIPGPLAGRGYARLESSQVAAFQAAWSGSEAVTAGRTPITIADFVADPHPPIEADNGDPGASTEVVTELEVLSNAVEAAAHELEERIGVAQWKRMLWLEPLKPLLELQPLLDAASEDAYDGSRIVVGMTDDPEQREQRPGVVDLVAGGGLLIYGAPKSGRTNLLETVAVSAVHGDVTSGAGSQQVVLFGIGHGRIQALEGFRSYCPEVASPNDYEAVGRVLDLLTEVIRERQEAGSPYRQSAAAPRYLLLVDGLDSLLDVIASNFKLEELNNQIHRIGREGAAEGVHLIATSSRVNGLRQNLPTWIGNRIVLAQLEPTNYTELGVFYNLVKPLRENPEFGLRPGRAFFNNGLAIQIAQLEAMSDKPDALIRATLVAFAEKFISFDYEANPSELPTRLGPIEAEVTQTVFWLGRAYGEREPVSVDLGRATLIVSGPAGSGKTSTLRSAAGQLSSAGAVCTVFTSADDVSWDTGPWKVVRPGGYVEGLNRVVETNDGSNHYLVFDDYDQTLDTGACHAALAAAIALPNVRVIASTSAINPLPTGNESPVHHLAADRLSTIVVLSPSDTHAAAAELDTTVRFKTGVDMEMPGRGLLRRDEVLQTVQVAYAGDDQLELASTAVVEVAETETRTAEPAAPEALDAKTSTPVSSSDIDLAALRGNTGEHLVTESVGLELAPRLPRELWNPKQVALLVLVVVILAALGAVFIYPGVLP